jgi:phosphoribosyl-AMP cyclohydrolase
MDKSCNFRFITSPELMKEWSVENSAETGLVLAPKYDALGLITAVVTHAETGEVLMLAHMNSDALVLTMETHIAHFWSRSRQALWKKGETSGHTLSVVEARIDCDQDAVWLKCLPAGPTCHTGQASCFYRKIVDGALQSD